jgi:glycosyltransferase involved in cell wall biosynthesis
LNGEKYLEQTFNSVFFQSYPNIEYIVIDGGSKDKTIDIIKQHESNIDYWQSEKDHGIYYAMNKGIELAKGDLIGILNADDYYSENTVKYVVEAYLKTNADIIHGDILFITDDTSTRMKPDFNQMNVQPSIFHPTCFVKKTVYQKAGSFDTTYKISADYDFLKLKEIVQRQFKKGLPNLSGPKIFNYWSFIIQEYGKVKLKNSEFIEIAPDTHITKCSILLGAITKEESEFLSKEKICVCDLADQLDLAQNLVSHHLKVLEEAGLLEKRREKNQIFYSIIPDKQEKVDLLKKLIGI